MMFFATEPLYEYHISIQTTAISDLGDTLMMHGFDANMMSSNRYDSLRTLSMITEVMRPCSIL